MNTRSIGFRLTLLYAGLLFLVGLAFGAYSYFSLSDYLSWDLRQFVSHRTKADSRSAGQQDRTEWRGLCEKRNRSALCTGTQ